MTPTAILWPMIAHALLVFIVYGALLRARYRAVKSGAARVSQFRERGSEPAGSAAAAGCLQNQFEAPVLFHAVCLALFVTAGVSYLTVLLAWIFALSRYVHAAVYLGTNRIRYRQPAFTAGLLAMLLMWILLALHIAGIA